MKRGSGEGTVRQRADGRWEARHYGTDGKQKSLYADTQAEVIAKLKGVRNDRDLGLSTRSLRLTTAAFLTKWIEGARANVHMKVLYGRSSHHHVEAVFKAFARALRVACSKDKQLAKQLPSTKGLL